MDFKELFAKHINSCLKDIDYKQIYSNIEKPPTIELGDYSFPTFFLAKYFKKNPVDIAKDLCEKLKTQNKYFTFFSKSAYLNVKIKDDFYFKNIIEDILINKEDYGKVKYTKHTYVIDTFNANPFKALHIGHLRNIVVGDSIHRILKFANQESYPISYSGDVGTHVAKWYWYYSSLNNKSKPEKNISKWFGEIYLKAQEKLSKNKEYSKEINIVQKKINEDLKLKKEIKELRDLCKKGYENIKEELDINLEGNLYESEAEQEFLKIKEELFRKYPNIFYESNGAYIADLKRFGLDVLVLIKQNGSLLYAAKDIGLVKLKLQHYPKANNFLYVVGSEQKDYFKHLFKLFSLIYPKTKHKHVAHGLVNLETGKMASRKGSLILYEDFRIILENKVKEILEENKLSFNKKVLKDIVNGTIKFEMLSSSINKNITFNIKKAVQLQGDSSAYIQYSGVRAKSILNKIKENIDLNLLKELKNIKLDNEERELLNLLLSFKSKVDQSYLNFKPNIISNYCLDLAHSFSKFYSNCPVLNSSSIIRKRRLLLIKAYYIVLNNALNLIGINIPEKM
jgi:arginyl-tRNA synthetase